MEVGEGSTRPGDVLLVELAARWLVGNQRVVTNMVGGQQLVHCGQVSLVPGLFNKTPGKGFILFC